MRRRASRRFAACLCFALAFLLLAAEGEARQPPRPPITAQSAVVVDAKDGHVLYRRSAERRRPIASTTKLMTALLTLEELSPRRRLRAAPYNAAPAESQIHLSPGERLAVRDLLRALLLESANDAAVTLARGAAGSVHRFVGRMNQRAQDLGLLQTHYSNPIGLDEAGNFSSALDLAHLAVRLLRNRTFAAIVDMPRARLRTGSRPRVVDNRNDLVGRVPWIDGVKTGHTNRAGYVLVGAGKRKGIQLVSVVLGCPTEAARDADTIDLLGYGFRLYRRVRIASAGAKFGAARVRFFGDRRVPLVARSVALVSVRPGERVRTRVDAPDELEGPLDRGTRVGRLTVFVNGKPVRFVPLVTAAPVPKAGALRKAARHIGRIALILVLLAVAGMALRRGKRRRSGIWGT